MKYKVLLFSKPWFQEKVILVSLPGGQHRFSSWRRWLGCCSNPAVRNRQRKTVDFQRVKKTAKEKKVNRRRGEFIYCVDIVLSHWNIEVWKKLLPARNLGWGTASSRARESWKNVCLCYFPFFSGTCSWFTILHVHLLFDLLKFC